MTQTIDEEDIEAAVNKITTKQEEELKDVLYATKLIIYVLNFLSKTKSTSYFVLSMEWMNTL